MIVYSCREDLHTAERIWARLWRRKALPDSGILLACIEQAKKSEDWNKSGGKFIPWLKNFLRGERWKEWLPAALDHEKQFCSHHRAEDGTHPRLQRGFHP